MKRRDVVTSFLQHNGRVLILKRSPEVSTHRGEWAGVSGSIDAGTPLEQAIQEIREETGLENAEFAFVRSGRPLDIAEPESDVVWRVHSFLFSVHDPARIRLNWEHTESRWVDPAELDRPGTVPRLKDVWEQLWKT